MLPNPALAKRGVMRSMDFGALIPCLLAVTLTGCGEADPASAGGVVVRDSAGVTIVENPGDPWTGSRAWRLADEPSMRIGELEGDEAYLFARIQDLAPLSDGGVVVAERADLTLRWFGPDGAFRFRRGGAGEAPGEFMNLGRLTTTGGDTLVVRDRTLGRVSTFAPDGTVLDHVTADEFSQLAGPVYRLADGSYLLGRTGAGGRPGVDLPREPGLVRVPVALIRLSPERERLDTVGIFPGTEMEVHRRDGVLSADAAYFFRSLSYTAREDRIFIGPQDPFEIHELTPEGERVRTIRALDAKLALDDEFLDAFRDWMLGRSPPELRAQRRRQLDGLLSEMTLPERVPAYSELMVDDEGNLWLGEYRFELAAQPPVRWVVFDPEGRFLSAVDLPEGYRLLAVAGRRAWGVQVDELDVERVAVYEIER